MLRSRWTIGALVIAAGACGVCGAKWLRARWRRAPDAEERVREFATSTPNEPIRDMETSESLSEEVSDRLLALCEEWRRKEFDDRAQVLATDFTGPALLPPPAGATTKLPFDIEHEEHDVTKLPTVDRAGFLKMLAAALSPWRALSCLRIDVTRAEFTPGPPICGSLEWLATIVGDDADGRRRSISARGTGVVRRERRRWAVASLELRSMESLARAHPIFREVTAAAGLAYHAVPFDNASYAWSGAACGDVNGDGLLDFFVPSDPKNFLFVARPEGGFADEAELRGVATPGSGTGALFFDFDNDRDLDLVIVDEGWHDPDGTAHGNPLRIFRNERGADGAWRFVDATKELGIDYWSDSSSVVAFDYDQDGWLDLFVCNYGQPQTERNNSWVHADNAPPNALFRNVDGRHFENVAAAAGVASTRWAYAACAADWDRDGDIDLYVVNDFGPNHLMQNDGHGHFTDEAEAKGATDLGFGMSASFGDLDNDGRLDLYVSNMSGLVADRILARLDPTVAGMDSVKSLTSGNSILLQRDGRFELQPHALGAWDGRWAWGSQPCDLDLDGRLDLVCVNGFITRIEPGDVNTYFWRQIAASTLDAEHEPTIRVRQQMNSKPFKLATYDGMWRDNRSWSGRERDKVWLNGGRAGFVDVSAVSGADSDGDGRGLIVGDFDDDGDADLFVHEMQRERHHLYRNDAKEKPTGFLKVRLEATRGHWSGVGAEVIVTTPSGPCSQVLSIGSGYVSCQPAELLFGIGSAPTAAVEVIWPGNVRESFGTIAADSRVLLVQGSGAARAVERRPHALERPTGSR